jgi:hypothetical protein
VSAGVNREEKKKKPEWRKKEREGGVFPRIPLIRAGESY